MSSTALSTQKPTPVKGTGDNITELNGWQPVGYYGSCMIYARGNKRQLVNPETSEYAFEYTVVNSGRTKRE